MDQSSSLHDGPVGPEEAVGAGDGSAPAAVTVVLPVLADRAWFKPIDTQPSVSRVTPSASAKIPFVRSRPLAPLLSGPRREYRADVLQPNGAGQPAITTPSGVETAETAVSVLEARIADLKLSEIRTDRLERDLVVLRRELNRLQTEKRVLDLEQLEAKRTKREFDEKLDKVKSTISFQLGSALVDSKSSWRAAAGLPRRLYYVFRSSQALKERHAKSRDEHGAGAALSAEAAQTAAAALAMIPSGGGERAAAWARAQIAKPAVRAYTLVEIAKAVSQDNALLSGMLGIEAVELDPSEHRAKALAFQLADLGHIRPAVALINKAVVAGAKFNTSEARKTDHLRSLARLLDSPPVVPARSRDEPRDASKHVALIGRQMLPYHVSSASLRLEDRARQIEAAGWNVTLMTPPGYPGDGGSKHAVMTAEADASGGAPRRLCLTAAEHPEDVTDLYVSAAAARIAAAAVATGASIIQADGYFVNGVAAAFAARACRRALVLEFNELFDPHDPFPKSFENTEKGKMSLWMSLLAARAADMCIVPSAALADVLAGAGIPRANISVMPHRIASEPAVEMERQQLAAHLGLDKGPVIGVVRDLCESYDMGAVAEVLAQLAGDYPTLKLLVVGQGQAGAGLRHRVAERRLGDRLVLIDQPAPAHMALYRSLLDVSVFTRIDTLRAAVTSAYEIAAAMASARAVVAFRTPDAVSLIEDGVSGYLCAPANSAEMATRVKTLLSDGPLRGQIGASARQAYLSTVPDTVATPQLSALYARLAGGERPFALSA